MRLTDWDRIFVFVLSDRTEEIDYCSVILKRNLLVEYTK